MDSVTKELAEATNRIKILKRQLAQQSDKNGGHNGHNRLIYRPIRGDTILRHHHKRRTFPTPDEMETVLWNIYYFIAVHWSEANLIPEESSRVVINETKTIKTPFEVAKKMSRKKRRRHLPSLLQEPRFFPLLDIERRKSLLHHLQHLFPEIYWIYFAPDLLKSDKMSKMDDMMVQTIFFCQAWMGVCMALA